MMSNRHVGESWEWLDLLESDYSAPPWYIDQMLPQGGSIVVEAPQGSGKSMLTQQMALCLATGTDFVGLAVDKPHKVLYLQCEGHLGDTAQRGHDMHVWLPRPSQGMLTVDFLLRKKINTRAGFQALSDLCEEAGLDDGVLFIDPVYKTIRGSMKDDEIVGEWTDNVDLTIHKFNSAAVVVHHESRPVRTLEGKKIETEPGEKTYGSAFWLAWANYGFQLARLPGRDRRLQLTCWKPRRPTTIEDNPLMLTMVEPRPLGFEVSEEGVTSVGATIRLLTKCSGLWYTKDELASAVGKSLSPVQKAVEELVDRGWLEEGDGRPRKYRHRRGDSND